MTASPHRRAILLLSFAAFAAGSSMRICDPLLPEFARAFHVSASQAALTISAFALTYGLMQAFYGPLGDHLGWRWCFGFLAGVYLLVGLALLRESRVNPEAPAAGNRPAFGKQLRSVLALPWVRVILSTVFVESVAVFSVLAFVPSHLHLHFGLSLAAAGAVPATFGLGGLGYAFLARRAVAHFGEGGLILAGGTALTLASLVLAIAPHWGWALPAAFLLGAGFYMFHNTLQTHATQMAPAQRGTAVSLFAASFFLGQFTGVAAASRMAEQWGHRPAFALAALIAAGVTVGFGRRLAGRTNAAR